jgi:hypothetical protein
MLFLILTVPASSAPPDINAHGIDVLCYGSPTDCEGRKADIYDPLKGLWVQVTPGAGKLHETLISPSLLPNYLLHVELLTLPATGTDALDFAGITAQKVIAIKGSDDFVSPLTLPKVTSPVIDYLILIGGKFTLQDDANVKALYVAATVTLDVADAETVTTVYAYTSPAKASAVAAVLVKTAKLGLIFGAADTVTPITVTTTGFSVGTENALLNVNAGGENDPDIVMVLLDGDGDENKVDRDIKLVPGTRSVALAFTISCQGSVLSAVLPPAYTPANPVAGDFTLGTDVDIWTAVAGGLTVNVQPENEDVTYVNKGDNLKYAQGDLPVLFEPPQVNKKTPTQEPEEAGDPEAPGGETSNSDPTTIQTPGSADEGTGTQTTQAPVIGEPKDGGGGNDDNDDGGLSGGAIAGIVIGVVAAVGIAGFCVWYFVLRPKKIGVEGAKP